MLLTAHLSVLVPYLCIFYSYAFFITLFIQFNLFPHFKFAKIKPVTRHRIRYLAENPLPSLPTINARVPREFHFRPRSPDVASRRSAQIARSPRAHPSPSRAHKPHHPCPTLPTARRPSPPSTPCAAHTHRRIGFLGYPV